MKKITVSIILTIFVLSILSSVVSCDNIFVIAILNNKVHVKTSGNGTAFATPDYAEDGRFISLTATPGDGYLFDRWVVESGSAKIQNVYANPGAFSMPSNVVTVRAVFEEINNFFQVIVEDDGNGTGEADGSPAHIGREVVITAFPNDGYVFDKWEVIQGEIEILDKAENPAVFIMPAEDVTVKATFKEIIHNAYATSVVFNDVIYGYDQPDLHTMTVHNISEYTFNVYSIDIRGDNADKFILNGEDGIKSISSGGEASFTIQPKAGLNAGVYEAEVVIAIDYSVEIKENISFTVKPKQLTLNASNILNRSILTPLNGETTAMITIGIYGLINNDAANTVVTFTDPVPGITYVDNINTNNGTFTYNGTSAVVNPTVLINVSVGINASSNYSFANGTPVSFNLIIYDGQADYTGAAGTYDRRIPVNQGNISAFNTYANTTNGLSRHYKLTQDVVLNAPAPGGSNWSTIGKSSAFYGSFNGQGYSISNLTINESAAVLNVGMFSYLEWASVKNLGLINVNIRGEDIVGGIAGYLSMGVRIENCFVTGTLQGYDVGGIVGINSEGDSVIRNSYSTCTATGSSAAGGIAGNNSGTIEYCYASGDIKGGSNAGGITGYSYSIVRNCIALNKTVSSNSRACRIIGTASGSYTMSNNRAYSFTNLLVNNAPRTAVNNLASVDGLSVTTNALKTQSTWSGSAGFTFSSSVWKWNAGYMPSLFNERFEWNSTFIEMVWIPAGTFKMGSPTTEADRMVDENYRTANSGNVTLTQGFYMGIYEITQEQWFTVMGSNPSRFSSNPAAGEVQGRRPVEQVSWYDAIVFCNKLSMMEGLTPAYRINNSADPAAWGTVPSISSAAWDAVTIVSGSTGYRLPTEAQWEYACRAGTTTAFNTGSNSTSDSTGWHDDNSGGITHEVGKKPPNAWGLYDMHGNIVEWCWDWYTNNYNNAGGSTNPMGASTGSDRVIRGGNYTFSPFAIRSAFRYTQAPHLRIRPFSGYDHFLGFRVIRP